MKLLLVLMFFLTSCALFDPQPVQKLDPAIYYKNDMKFWHKKKMYKGVAVIPEEDKVTVTANTNNNIGKFVLTTCHRETDWDDPDRGWFRRKGRITLTMRPTVEKGRACPYYFGSFDKNGRHSWGVVALRGDNYQLKAKVFCNGSEDNAVGAYICQSREGLIQTIIFDEPVAIARPVNGPADRKEDCPPLKLKTDHSIEYKTPNRECLYGIIGRDSLKAFQLYTIGYEQLIVR